MPAPNTKAVLAAAGTLALAIITLLTVFTVVEWSAAQTALVTAEVGSLVALGTALVAHFKPSTSKEQVAIAATLTATVAATVALGSSFGWWHLTETQSSALGGVITAVLGVGGAMFARQHVQADLTPDPR
jgi:hypothetical protein